MGAIFKLAYLFGGIVMVASWLVVACTPESPVGHESSTTRLPDTERDTGSASSLSTVSARPPVTIPATFSPYSNTNSSGSRAVTDEGLFTISDRSGSLDTTNDPTVIRSRPVDVNLALLERAEGGDAIVLNLFDDVVYTAVLDSRQPTSIGFAWTGHIAGTEHSMVTLIVGGGQLAGNITLPKAQYQVRYAGEGVHGVYEIRQSAFPDGDEPILPDG